MSRRNDVARLVQRLAGELDLRYAHVRGAWHVTNPRTQRSRRIPARATRTDLDQCAAEIRALADPPPADDARGDTGEWPHHQSWDVATLLGKARENGLRPYVSGGALCTPGPDHAQPFADMLRARETEVIAYLARHAPHEGEPAMPEVDDTEPAISSGGDDRVARDAQALYDLVREQARAQGDVALSNGGTPGVQWVGSLTALIEEVGEDWAEDHVQRVRHFLNRTGHTSCHQRWAKPPVWWVADAWHGKRSTGVSRPARDRSRTSTRGPRAQAPPSPGTPAVNGAPQPSSRPTAGALAAFRAMHERLHAAEQRAAAAEEKAADLRRRLNEAVKQRDAAHAELAQARRRLAQQTAELEEINALIAQYGPGAAAP